MRILWAFAAALFGLASAATAQTAAPVQVMVVGTYHFANPGLDIHNVQADDVLRPQRQRELEALAASLAEFRPTKIMVERVSDDLVDAAFSKFTPADLSRQRDERVQIGFRVAHRLGHRAVYAIDEQPGEGEPDYFPFGKVAAWAKANGSTESLEAMMAAGAQAVKLIEELQKTRSIAGVLAEFNTPAMTEKSQNIYYEVLRLGDIDQQPGADLNAMWYLRNAKIFAKLMQAAEPGDRVLVVYGMGHNYWLRHFAGTVPGYRSVDPTPFLLKAAATN